MAGAEGRPSGAGRRIAVWMVHALTASGAVLGFLALEAAMRADAPWTFLWLAIALVVDGIDGPIARRLDAAATLPRIDGAALDLVVDYLTYVVVPAVFLLAARIFPPGVAHPLCGFILVSALYTFARRDMKTESADFRGFPAVWNLVAAGFVATGTTPWAAAAIALVLGLLTFTSVRTVHPIRVVQLRPLTAAATLLWLAATGALIAAPDWNRLPVLAAWWLSTAYVCGLCAWRSLRSVSD